MCSMLMIQSTPCSWKNCMAGISSMKYHHKLTSGKLKGKCSWREIVPDRKGIESMKDIRSKESGNYSNSQHLDNRKQGTMKGSYKWKEGKESHPCKFGRTEYWYKKSNSKGKKSKCSEYCLQSSYSGKKTNSWIGSNNSVSDKRNSLLRSYCKYCKSCHKANTMNFAQNNQKGS